MYVLVFVDFPPHNYAILEEFSRWLQKQREKPRKRKIFHTNSWLRTPPPNWAPLRTENWQLGAEHPGRGQVFALAKLTGTECNFPNYWAAALTAGAGAKANGLESQLPERLRLRRSRRRRRRKRQQQPGRKHLFTVDRARACESSPSISRQQKRAENAASNSGLKPNYANSNSRLLLPDQKAFSLS